MIVEIGKYSYKTPDTWNEMTTKQAVVCASALCHIAFRMHKYKLQAVQDHERRKVLIQTIPYLLGMPLRRWKRVLKNADASQLAFLLQITDVIFSDHTKTNAFKLINENKNLFEIQKEARIEQLKLSMLPTKQLMPTLSWPWYTFKTYYGPVDRLYNITIEEFKYADAFFLKTWKNPESNAINEFIATLYRLSKPNWKGDDGDRREPFNEHTIAKRSKAFQSMPIGIKYLILIWYKGCRTYLQARFKSVYPEQAATNLAGKPQPMSEVIMAMAGSSFGTYQETKRAALYDFMNALNSKLEQIANQKSKQNAST